MNENNMSTTPRTDAQFIPHPDEPTTPAVQIHTEVIALRAENADLREQLDDWNNAVLHAKDYRADEQHCGCVPVLIGKVSDLERENAELNSKLDAILTNAKYEGGVQFWIARHDALILKNAELLAANAELIAVGAELSATADELRKDKARLDAAIEEETK